MSSLTSWHARAPRLYLHTKDGVREPVGGRGPRYWIVARELCRFFPVPLLAEATARQQLDALALQIERQSPFRETGHHFHLGTNVISLWLWDQSAAHAAAEAIGVELDGMRMVPETALIPRGGTGARLVETLSGVEGQSWNNGDLAASRWWPTVPDDRSWVMFQRGASLPPDQITATAPMPLHLDWLDRPWTRMPSLGARGLAGIDMRLAAAIVGVLIVAVYGYLGAEWLRLTLDTHKARTESAELLRRVAPIIDARSTALTNEATIEKLRKLDPLPGQLSVMARVAEVLPHNDAYFADWTFDRGQLQVTIASRRRLDAVYFVKSLEAVRGFKNVSAERAYSDNSLRIHLTVEPK
ncbi:MAG TPA: hypothetical protein VMU87_18220 [Stellaceae bacterium]|nr:hypothetical protein [Stellaceae bacterium]